MPQLKLENIRRFGLSAQFSNPSSTTKRLHLKFNSRWVSVFWLPQEKERVCLFIETTSHLGSIIMFVDIFSSVLQKYLKDIITMASILRENMHISPSLELPQDACFGSQTWEDIQITSKTLKENTAFYDTMHYRVIFGSGENLPGARIVSSIVTWRHYIHLFGSFFFQLSLEALQPSKIESM